MKRYIIFGFSLLLLSVSPLSAQEKSRVIKGFVKDYSTKLPISGAMVRVAEVEGYSTLSRSDGSYELEVPLFVSSLEISAPETNLVKIGLQKVNSSARCYSIQQPFLQNISLAPM